MDVATHILFARHWMRLDPQTHQPLGHRPKVRLSHPMCDLPNPTTPSEVHQHFCRCPKEVNAPCTSLGRGAKMLSGNQDRVEGRVHVRGVGGSICSWVLLVLFCFFPQEFTKVFESSTSSKAHSFEDRWKASLGTENPGDLIRSL